MNILHIFNWWYDLNDDERAELCSKYNTTTVQCTLNDIAIMYHKEYNTDTNKQ